MAKKKKFVFRMKDSVPTEGKYMGTGERKDEDSFDDKKKQLVNDIKSLHNDLMKDFFKQELGLDIINQYEAVVHIEQNCNSERAVSFIQETLDKFLKRKYESPPEEESKEENPEQGQDKQKAGDSGFDVPENPEQESPESSNSSELPDFPSFEEMTEQEFKDNMEQILKEGLQSAKAKLENFLDRLTIVEAKVEEDQKNIKTLSDVQVEFPEKIETLKNVILKVISEKFESMGSGDGGSSVPTSFTMKYEDPKKPDKEMKGVFPKEWERILQLASSRVNILLVGPAGCGKTYISSKVSEALDLGFAAQSCSEGMDESVFSGTLLPLGDQGQFEYVPSTFVEFYEKGGVYLLDEIDAADGNLMTFINSALGNSYFYLPRRWKQPLVKRHKDFVCIAAANTFGNGGDDVYTARNALDGATLDRFRAGIVNMDYDERVERSLIDEEVYTWGYWIRKGIVALKQNRVMSTRVMQDFTKLKIQHNWSLEQIRDTYFTDWGKDDVIRIDSWVNKELEEMRDRIKQRGV